MSAISLAALTILDAGPIGQVYAAKEGGFSSVGLRLQPLLATDQAIVGDAAKEAALIKALADTGMKVLEIGVFPLKASTVVEDLAPVVAFSSKIGARYLVCPIEDDDKARRVATFAAVCDLAARYSMEALVEFNPYSGCRSLAEAAELARDAARPNGKLLIDVLHLSRSGGSPEDARRIDSALVPLVHFCDAPPSPMTIAASMSCARNRAPRACCRAKEVFGSPSFSTRFRPMSRSASRRRPRVTPICRRASARVLPMTRR